MSVQRYVERPQQIEALPAHELLDTAKHDWASLPDWVRDAHETGRLYLKDDSVTLVSALGWLDATGDDMVFFQGGSLKKMQGNEFAAAYAPASAEDVTP